MGALSNTRHERFAQELAKGKSAAQAYIAAGYSANDGNAIRLKGNERVAARVAEIRERGAIRAEVTVATLIEELEQARKAALSADTPQSSAAVAASLGKAKLLGLIVDKSSVDATVRRAEEMSEAELVSIARGGGEGVATAH